MFNPTRAAALRLAALLALLIPSGCAHRSAPRAAAPVAADPAAAASHLGPGLVVDGMLQRRLESLVAGFPGDVGIYVRRLDTSAGAALAPDDTFPTASMVKLPLLAALFHRVHDGALFLDSTYVLTDSSVVQTDEEDIIAQLRWGEPVHLRKLAFLMMGTSDNTASVWIQQLIGGSDTANAWLDRNGFTVTRDNSRLPHRHEIWHRWGWGMTTPREIAELLVRVREGRVVSRAASEAMYRLMKGSYWYEEALAGVPPTVGVASKQGAVNRSRSEVLLVESPTGPYVLSVITKNQQDESWDADNAGFVLLRRVSWEVWHHFNPNDPWRPHWLR